MEESLVGLGPLWKGCWAATKEVFTVTRLTVGVSNDLQMARNFTGGLPVVYQGRLARLKPFRECLTPAHKRDKRGTPEDIGVPDCKTDNGENARMYCDVVFVGNCLPLVCIPILLCNVDVMISTLQKRFNMRFYPWWDLRVPFG